MGLKTRFLDMEEELVALNYRLGEEEWLKEPPHFKDRVARLRRALDVAIMELSDFRVKVQWPKKER